MEACTPSRLTSRATPALRTPGAVLGRRSGDLFGWIKMLAEWREAGDFAGLELDQPVLRLSAKRSDMHRGGEEPCRRKRSSACRRDRWSGGIGAAIAEEFGRAGAYVVTLDPVVSLDGSSRLARVRTEHGTADRRRRGTARASNTSVTDREAVEQLFAELVTSSVRLDAVVNVAGISRPTDFASGTEEDWAAVLEVHLDGYLNVLGAALPLMAKRGSGPRSSGVTSGSGWRPANTGAYGCAKRAVAALTWQIGRTTPQGVTVNALSPIAATRMVTAGGTGLRRRSARGGYARTGGLGLGSMPPPEHLGPVGAYLAGEEFSWCQGQVIFSGGSELA